MTQTLTTEAILNALKHIQDPDLGRDLVSLNMIRDVVINGGDVSLRVVLTTPACPVKEKFQTDVRDAIQALPGVKSVKVAMDAEVRGARAQVSGGTQSLAGIPGVTNIIAVSSGKGGVGKSTVAANLAVALAREGARVGLLDADVYGPNIPTMMGVTEHPRIEKVKNEKGQEEEFFLPPTAKMAGVEIKIMSMGFLVQNDQPLVWRGPMLHSVVNQFCYKVRWGELDYLVVDMPPGTGDVQLSLAQLVPVTGAVLVTTPQEVSMQDVRKAFHMFEKVRVPVMGFVENMSYFVCDGCDKRHFLFGKDGGVLLAKKFHTDLLAQLPMIPAVREGGDLGRPVMSQPEDTAGIATFATPFRELARKVAQRISILNLRSRTQSEVQIGSFS